VAAADPVSAADARSLFSDLTSVPALILAVSGGPDSTALMVLAARWRAALGRGPALFAVTVDHGLRPGSGAEARAVKRLAAALGVAHRTLRWSGEKPATGLPEKARAARYRLLAAAARKAGAAHILTAHTLDDQAETVLFRLARGSGLTGLGAMARETPLAADGVPLAAPGPAALTLVRPFLGLPKARLLATLRAAKIPFADDPSNRDPRFTRARLRELLPRLAPEGLDAQRLALLARRLRRADAAIEAAVDRAAAELAPPDGARMRLDAGAWAGLAAELRLRLLARAIARFGEEGAIELAKLEACEEALAAALRERPSARFRRTLAGAMVTLAGGALTIERAPPRRKPPKSAGQPRTGSNPVHQRTVK
jgi:tRNA(Ile)-lysidine synthase